MPRFQDHSKTLRERLAITEQEYCWRCHQKMNPLGYSFEVYDDFGRYRQEETLDKLPKVDGEFVSRKVDAAPPCMARDSQNWMVR